MKTIKRSDVEREKQILQEISNDKTLRASQKYEAVENMGYELEYLGAGESAYMCAHLVKEMLIKSRRYLKGEYLCYGTFNLAHGRGVIYRGYVKEIVEDDVK